MFRIECFCDDAKLAKILWALTELGAYNVTNHPVADTKPNGTNGRYPRMPTDELLTGFIAYAKKHRLKTIRAPDVRAFVKSMGMNEDGYSNILDKLRRANAVTKVMGRTGSTVDVSWRVTISKIKPTRPGAASS